MSSARQFEVRADPRVRSLVAGEPEPVWGAVLVANWPPPPELEAPHARAVSALTGAADAFAEHAYVNPFGTLHTTVMTCHGFTKPAPANKADYIAGWKSVLDAASTCACFPRRSFSITTARSELHAGAGVLLYEDTDGGFTAVRDCILQEMAAKRCVCPASATLAPDAPTVRARAVARHHPLLATRALFLRPGRALNLEWYCAQRRVGGERSDTA
jgi:hypothetical protein